MEKLRIYLDTSVISAYLDHRERSRQRLTQEFWSRLSNYQAYVCPIVIREINQIADSKKQAEMLELIKKFDVLPWQGEMEELAKEYIRAKVFSPAMLDDARHVAACVVSDISILLSWNFKHLVNRRRRILVNLVNLSRGYREIEILAPAELS